MRPRSSETHQRRLLRASPSVAGIDVGRRLREMRRERGFSLRALAADSGLNVNTLSLIENGRTSPSVATLAHLARALDVPVTAFFEVRSAETDVVFQRAGDRAGATFAHGILRDLGAGLSGRNINPFLVVLEPEADSGERAIAHTGIELVYCLEGVVSYRVEQQTFLLGEGDSLCFRAHLPHRWRNPSATRSRSLLVITPADEREESGSLHFSKAVGFHYDDGKHGQTPSR